MRNGGGRSEGGCGGKPNERPPIRERKDIRIGTRNAAHIYRQSEVEEEEEDSDEGGEEGAQVHGTEQDIRQPDKGYHHDGNRLEKGCDESQRGGEEAVASGILLTVGSMENLHKYHREHHRGLELPTVVDGREGGGGEQIEEERQSVAVAHHARCTHHEEDGVGIDEHEREGEVARESSSKRRIVAGKEFGYPTAQHPDRQHEGYRQGDVQFENLKI